MHWMMQAGDEAHMRPPPDTAMCLQQRPEVQKKNRGAKKKQRCRKKTEVQKKNKTKLKRLVALIEVPKIQSNIVATYCSSAACLTYRLAVLHAASHGTLGTDVDRLPHGTHLPTRCAALRCLRPHSVSTHAWSAQGRAVCPTLRTQRV